MNRPFSINGIVIPPGERRTVNLPAAKLYTHTSLAMPVHVVNGRKAGPRLFVCAAIHGDEINGVEIIRRLLKHPSLERLRGTLVAIPIVNVHGFLDRSRYLPDRRDLNRSFPGLEAGSLASRIASLLMSEIVGQCDYGIDLHTGAMHRTNLPQLRAALGDEETARLARAFGTPVLIDANLRDGSLRQAAVERGVKMLLYEAGEALRFDEISIRGGLRGILNVLRELEMIRRSRRTHRINPVVARSSVWIRAPDSGIFRAMTALGSRVERGALLGVIADSFGENEVAVESPADGIIVGRTNLPLVHEGEALYHLARFREVEVASCVVEEFREALSPIPAPATDPEGPIV